MTLHPNLDQLNPEQLRALAAQFIQRVETMHKQITHHKSVNEKLAHEIALLKRLNVSYLCHRPGRSSYSHTDCLL